MITGKEIAEEPLVKNAAALIVLIRVLEEQSATHKGRCDHEISGL